MNTKPRAIFLCANPRAISNAYDAQTLQRLRELANPDENIRTPDRLAGLEDVEYIFSTWGMPCLTGEQIEVSLPRLKAVLYAAGSVQPFARPFLARGITVHSAWGANAVPVAEVACSEILLANKGFFQCPGLFRICGKPAAAQYHLTFPGNYGARVGILGLGMVGSLVAKKLRANDLQVLVYDPYASDEKIAALGARRADLN